jgi:guanidinopropionase
MSDERTADDHGSDELKVVETLYWWGVPSLFRCAIDPDPAHCDVALVGVPHSSGNGSTERDQHLGPRAVRNVSAHNRRLHKAFGAFSPWDACRINDLGDVPLPEAMDNEACVERISAFFRRIADAGARPVAIGGDHSISGAILQAIAGADSRLTDGKPVALVHLDAHTDTYENIEHWMGARKSAAHWAAYTVRQGNVDPTRSVQLGIRGNIRTPDWLATSQNLGYDLIEMEEYRRLGPEATLARIRERVGDGPVYISFDLDCLDPSVAPAVSNLEAGEAGFGIDEANAILRGLRGLDVVGADVVCLMPTKDSPNGITAMNAMAIMFELVTLVAERAAAERA